MAEPQARGRRRTSRPQRKSLYDSLKETPGGAAELSAARFTSVVDDAVRAMLSDSNNQDRVCVELGISESRLREITDSCGILHTSTLAKIASICGWELSIELDRVAKRSKIIVSPEPSAQENLGRKYAQLFIGPNGSERHTYRVHVSDNHFPAGDPEPVLEPSTKPSQSKVERYAGSVRMKESVSR